jgi:hypothetical protein
MVLQYIPRASVANYIPEVGRVLKPGERFLFQILLLEPNGAPEPPGEITHAGCATTPRAKWGELLRSARMILLERFNEMAAPAPDDPTLNGLAYQVIWSNGSV